MTRSLELAECVDSDDGRMTNIERELMIERNVYDIEERYIYHESMLGMISIISRMRPKYTKVLQLRYGLCGEYPMSYTEMGNMWDVSRGRIKRIHDAAIVELRDRLDDIRPCGQFRYGVLSISGADSESACTNFTFNNNRFRCFD
jgi:DNA-directed RNA polymerase sigma subunit (sigma70/sigma32)